MTSNPSMNSDGIQHEFICIDKELATLLHIDERESSKDWRVPIGHPEARDSRLIGGRLLIAGFNFHPPDG